jgi:dTDP-4-amino-4,6-dideoxygalactose transaminase
MTLDERWEARRQEWIQFYQANQRTPSRNATDDAEKRIAMWQGTMRYNKKKGKLSQERIDQLNQTDGWKWEADTFPENLQKWLRFYQTNQRTPSQNATDDAEKRIAIWQQQMRQRKKKGKLSQERIDQLNQTDGWKWDGRT